MLRCLPLLLLLIACGNGVPTTPETRPVDNPNADNTAIYDVDPDDPYEIGDGAFLDMRPGARVADFPEILQPRSDLQLGKSILTYAIIGREKEELGFVTRNRNDTSLIAEIVITSSDVVTEDGLRIGYTYPQIVERIGSVEVGATPDRPAIYVTQDRLVYLLDTKNKAAVESAKIEQIIISR